MKKKALQIGITEIVEVTYGTLLNRPSISFFHQISSDLHTLQKGDLFIVHDMTQIEPAIAKGAFGILFSGEIAMNDAEVAWICVDNLENALLRILRHFLIMKNILFFGLDRNEFEILQATLIAPSKKLCFDGQISQLIPMILAKDYSHVFYALPSKKEEIIQTIPELHQTKPKKKGEASCFELIASTLFEIKIFYQSHQYAIALPKLFLQPFTRVLELAQEYALELDLNQDIQMTNFHPLYLDVRGWISEPGSTNRVLISLVDLEIYQQYLVYFSLYAKWAKLMLFVPPKYQELFAPYAEVQTYLSKQELFEHLLISRYNFALIFGVETAHIEQHFQKKQQNCSLFDFDI